MAHTRRKLDEAKFFLRLADDNRHTDEFNFYLSACVSAARSVTWIMRSEYARSDGWENWFQSKEPSAEEKILLRQINNVRVRSVKQRPLEARPTLNVLIPPEYLTEDVKARMQTWTVGTRFRLAAVQISDSGEISMHKGFPKDAIVGICENLELRLDEIPDEDVIEALRRYIGHLDELVSECERLHAH